MNAERAEQSGGGRGLRIGRILGVPVHISVAWLVMAVLLVVVYAPVLQGRLPGVAVSQAYLVAAAFVGLLLASVLAHELGHAVTAQRLGIRVRAMTLWMLGGYTELEREPSTPAGEFLVAVAGPAVSLALGAFGAAVAAVTPDGGIPHELAIQFALSNVLVGIFNLLPGLPLDGGSLVRAGLWRLTGDRHGATIASGWTGRVVAVLVLAGGAALGATWSSTGVLLTIAVGVFLWIGASRAIRVGRLARRLPLVAASKLASPFLGVPSDLPLAEAQRRAEAAGARSLVVVDGAGRPTGVVSGPAAAAIPPERRPWVPVSSVARTVEPGMIVPAHLTGEQLLRALHAFPSTEYVIGDGDRVVGVLVAADVADTLDPRGSRR